MITRSAHKILAWEKEHSLILSYDHLEADKAQVIVLNPQKITKKKRHHWKLAMPANFFLPL